MTGRILMQANHSCDVCTERTIQFPGIFIQFDRTIQTCFPIGLNRGEQIERPQLNFFRWMGQKIRTDAIRVHICAYIRNRLQ